MGIRMRFRVDNWAAAEDVARLARGEPTRYLDHARGGDAEELRATPIVQPGDVWRVRWYADGAPIGPVAGYCIGCPTCGKVHSWTLATNCSAPRLPIPDRPGEFYPSCIHSGTGSCWTWTGSAEDGTLNATPSLHSVAALGGCGFHGWLTNGELTG